MKKLKYGIDKRKEGAIWPKFEYYKPRLYEVEFESGHIEEVMAVNARDAKNKTHHLQSEYGFYKRGNQVNK